MLFYLSQSWAQSSIMLISFSGHQPGFCFQLRKNCKITTFSNFFQKKEAQSFGKKINFREATILNAFYGTFGATWRNKNIWEPFLLFVHVIGTFQVKKKHERCAKIFKVSGKKLIAFEKITMVTIFPALARPPTRTMNSFSRSCNHPARKVARYVSVSSGEMITCFLRTSGEIRF